MWRALKRAMKKQIKKRKFESIADKVLSLPTLKFVIKEIESNEDGEPAYQG